MPDGAPALGRPKASFQRLPVRGPRPGLASYGLTVTPDAFRCSDAASVHLPGEYAAVAL